MFEVDVDVLVKAFESEDDVGTVLRTHLVFEAFLDWTFKHFVRGDLKTCVQPARSFEGKLSLAAALGLPVELAKAIFQLNKIRNKLAHQMEDINASQVEQFGREVDKAASLCPGVMPLINASMEFKIRNPGVVYKYGTGNARLDFVMASLNLAAIAIYWSADTHSQTPKAS